MRRRELISFAGGVALAWSLGARAQEPGRVYRIAFVVPVGRDEAPNLAFIDELRRLGFVEGENLLIVPGGFLTTNEQVAEVVPAMIKAAPDVIVVGGDLISRAFQKATQSIPLLVMTEDMVGAGFAASLARPGGNITGISLMSPELDGKRQELLIEAVPGVRRIATLADSNTTTSSRLRALEEAARARGVELSIHQVTRREEIGGALDAAKAAGAGALNVLASSLLFNSRAFIFDRVTALRLPAVYQWPEMAEQGGLIGYGPLIVQLYRDIMSRQLVQLLRGVSPRDLPVEQPTRFELVINVRAAKAIGHEVPAPLVLRADKVIE